MDWLLTLSTRAKLTLGFGVMLAFLLLSFITAYLGGREVQQALRGVLQRDQQIALQLVELRADENRQRSDMLEMQLAPDKDGQQALEREIGQRALSNDARLKQLYALAQDDRAIAGVLDRIGTQLAEYRRVRQQQIELLRAGRLGEARQLDSGGQRERYSRIRALTQELDGVAQQRMQGIAARIDRRFADILFRFGLLGAVALLSCLLLVVQLSRMLAGPLTALTERAARIAGGELQVMPLPSQRGDEIGQLERQFNRMAEALQQKEAAAKRIASGDLQSAVPLQSEQDALGHAFADMGRALQNKAEVARQIAAGNLTVTVPLQSEYDTLGQAFAEMVRSLQDKAEAARQIAAGNLAVSVPLQSERDALGLAFKTMVQSLQAKAAVAREIAAGNLTVTVPLQSDYDSFGQALAAMVENLRQINLELIDGMGVLTTSASQILSGTSQIASGAEQTAVSVTQTTGAVDEVRQTAQVATQKAKHVSEAAQQAVQIAQNGRGAVDGAVEGMQRIHEQMGLIADSIVRLSEQTQAIGEIISTVNDLADQSNLLAVNAAIEAAKAGDHGRGFTVVANEVKSLAEQSKQATVQVRAILGDIQKATSSAVLATEQGGKTVEAGVKQSHQAGDAIRQLAQSIGESAQAASQIAVSAQQQLVGMDQLALAMENILAATGQNKTSSKQAELAAHNLHELGQRLRELVARYRV